MLKKFLKFLKGNTKEREFDGSYLDHLLGEVRPLAARQLGDCPQHDPLLVVVAEILRQTKPNQWTEELPCPLADEQSPALPAPAPPPATPDESSDAFEIVEELDDGEPTEERDAAPEQTDEQNEGDEASEVEDTQLDDEQSEPSDDAPEEPREETQDPTDADESTPEDQEETAANDGGAETADIIEEEIATGPVSAAEVEQIAADLEASVDATGEVVASETRPATPPAPPSLDEIEEPEEPASPQASLDSPKVLQAGRIFLGLLIENDRLPVPMQLSVAETMLARDLLLGYFVEDEKFDAKAQELLALVEQKFNEGAFSQARILLQLFQTDRSTRINNDRNLFYEDMILRLGIRRRHTVSQTLLDELAEVRAGDEDLDVLLDRTSAWLTEHLHVKFHTFTRVPEDVDEWRALASKSRREKAAETFLRYIPPKRWRPLQDSTLSATEQVRAHISPATVKSYILRQLKTCYFVLRAVGDTGLEPYLDIFFDWSESSFEFNSVRLMPLLYRRTMGDSHLIDKIFEDAFRGFYREKAASFLRGFDDATIDEAARGVLESFEQVDFNKIPPGSYDLGGLVLDRLLGLEYHHPEFAFKIHRLT